MAIGVGILAAGFALNALGKVSEAFEFQNQVNYERNVLTNNTAMVLASRDSAIRDIKTRTAILSGKAYAMAGKAGVTTSGSVVTAAADIIAKAEVDKLRVNVQANNQVSMNAFRSVELQRQAKKKIAGSVLDAFVTTGAGVYSTFQ